MKTTKKQLGMITQILKTGGLVLLPLAIIVVMGMAVRSRIPEAVVQAKSISAQQQNAESQSLSVESIKSEPGDQIQGNETSAPTSVTSTANGITFEASNYRVDKAGNLTVDFCFDQIDRGDWTVNDSRVVDAQGLSAFPSGGELLEVRYPPTVVDGKAQQQVLDLRGSSQDVKNYTIDADPNTKTGIRCVAMTYRLPSKFDLTRFKVIIDNIIAWPNENEQCSQDYIAKMQAVLDEKQTGIKIALKTDQSDGGGMCGYDIVQKPEQMTLDQAMVLLGSNEMMIGLYGIRGPWVLEASVKK
jgi:hypothetical protein